jgi:eukaryotic-like serine/threonine-protein kinase
MKTTRMKAPEVVGKTLVGRYAVKGFLRQGGMATIFRAQDLQTGDQVAVKVLLPELTAEPRFVSRFHREARALERLDHPNIVRTLEIGADGEILFLALELLPGVDLLAALRKTGALSEPLAASILAQVCRGLHHAHRAGIVHRDIKPENVMVMGSTDDPAARPPVKVLDFGIAKLLDAEEGGDPLSHPTLAGVIVGTPAYVSPELGRGEKAGPPHDIYAAGVVLFEVLTGRRPFEGGSPLDIVMRHVDEEPPLLGSLRVVHPKLEAIVSRALQKRPNDRYPTALAMAEELEALLANLGSSDPLGEPTPTLQRHLPTGLPRVPRLGVDGESEETIRRVLDVRSPLQTLTMVVDPGELSGVRSPGPAASPSSARPSSPPSSQPQPPPPPPPPSGASSAPNPGGQPRTSESLQPLLASFEASIQSLRAEQLRNAQRLERALWAFGAVALLALLLALVSLVVAAV